MTPAPVAVRAAHGGMAGTHLFRVPPAQTAVPGGSRSCAWAVRLAENIWAHRCAQFADSQSASRTAAAVLPSDLRRWAWHYLTHRLGLGRLVDHALGELLSSCARFAPLCTSCALFAEFASPEGRYTERDLRFFVIARSHAAPLCLEVVSQVEASDGCTHAVPRRYLPLAELDGVVRRALYRHPHAQWVRRRLADWVEQSGACGWGARHRAFDREDHVDLYELLAELLVLYAEPPQPDCHAARPRRSGSRSGSGSTARSAAARQAVPPAPPEQAAPEQAAPEQYLCLASRPQPGPVAAEQRQQQLRRQRRQGSLSPPPSGMPVQGGSPPAAEMLAPPGVGAQGGASPPPPTPPPSPPCPPLQQQQGGAQPPLPPQQRSPAVSHLPSPPSLPSPSSPAAPGPCAAPAQGTPPMPAPADYLATPSPAAPGPPPQPAEHPAAVAPPPLAACAPPPPAAAPPAAAPTAPPAPTETLQARHRRLAAQLLRLRRMRAALAEHRRRCAPLQPSGRGGREPPPLPARAGSWGPERRQSPPPACWGSVQRGRTPSPCSWGPERRLGCPSPGGSTAAPAAMAPSPDSREASPRHPRPSIDAASCGRAPPAAGSPRPPAPRPHCGMQSADDTADFFSALSAARRRIAPPQPAAGAPPASASGCGGSGGAPADAAEDDDRDFWPSESGSPQYLPAPADGSPAGTSALQRLAAADW
eukprot:TRINITY_DN7633_c1_g1_i1.p1 TRINITY_DN7633_c1_g1~~TRINITY_DN7633_c1_g1_i1.p1  ORF type:complete len:703 (+),score=142.62 TRINITY_DN7633_c1_g1_i1:76-2184(+)